MFYIRLCKHLLIIILTVYYCLRNLCGILGISANFIYIASAKNY